MNARRRFKTLRKEFDAIARDLKIASDADRRALLRQLRDLLSEVSAIVHEVDGEVRAAAETLHH